MAAYAVAPGVLEPSTLLFTSVGTALCVASANTFNQFAEVPFDSQMKRTSTRPIVRGLISPLHAFTIGVSTASLGVAILYSLVNPTVAALGAANIVL